MLNVMSIKILLTFIALVIFSGVFVVVLFFNNVIDYCACIITKQIFFFLFSVIK